MTLHQLQKTVDAWIKTYGVRYFNPLTNLAQLTEEVGEVARILSRTYGEQSYQKGAQKKLLADELADVLFVVVCIANQTQTDLTKALKLNLEKKTKRDLQRHKQNSKLNRSFKTSKS
jgi:NTP pyrophosphatase (non-canonical NTP hydrolase)